MGVETSDATERVLGLERKVFQIRRNLDDLASWRIPNAEQNLAMLWAAASRQCTTTIAGNIISATSPLANSSLKVVGHTTGNDYGTYSVPTGTYSIAISGIDPADASLDFTPIGPTSPRYDPAGGITYTQSITQCQSNSLLDMRAGAATGYGYSLGANGCEHPIGTLTWVDSRIGTGTATVTTNGNFWFSACLQTNSYATVGVCPVARAATPIRFRFVGDGGSTGASIEWRATDPTTNQWCPAVMTCPTFTTVGPNTETPSGYGAVTAKTCPAVDLSTKFDITFSVNDQLWHNSLPETLRFYEA